MKNHYLILAAIALVTMACRPVSSGSSRGSIPREYHTAYIQSYGRCYDSVPYNVVSLDLYSDKLSLDDSANVMTGTGYNLYLSDIFIAGSTLEPGTYRSSESAEPFTFLPGRDFELPDPLTFVDGRKVSGSARRIRAAVRQIPCSDLPSCPAAA